MAQLVCKGRKYEWPDPTSITFRESKLIKDTIGISLVTILSNLAAGQVDEDVLLGMFLLAKYRADKNFDIEQIMDLSLTDIEFEEDDEEDEEADAPLTDSKPLNVEDSKKSSKKTTSKT